MTKTELRHHYLQKRLSLAKDDIDYLSQSICDRFFSLKEVHEKHFFHIFLPIVHNKEINTWPIIKGLWDAGKKVIVPISDFANYQMTNYFMEEDTVLEENKYGIPEPVDAEVARSENIDIVIFPLLAFDTLGYRVGYGKGFYDKFIRVLRHKVVKVGLSFFAPVEGIEDIAEWDERLDYCITPDQVYIF